MKKLRPETTTARPGDARRLLAYHEAQARYCRRRAQEAEAQRRTLTYRKMLSRGHQHERWAGTITRLIESASKTPGGCQG